MSDLKAEDYYNEIKEFVETPHFTKLTGTGINTDYKSIFEFAEAYSDARNKASGVPSSDSGLHLQRVSNSVCPKCKKRNWVMTPNGTFVCMSCCEKWQTEL